VQETHEGGATEAARQPQHGRDPLRVRALRDHDEADAQGRDVEGAGKIKAPAWFSRNGRGFLCFLRAQEQRAKRLPQ